MFTDREIERVIWLALPLNVDQFDVAKRILRKLDAHGLQVVSKPDPSDEIETGPEDRP